MLHNILLVLLVIWLIDDLFWFLELSRWFLLNDLMYSSLDPVWVLNFLSQTGQFFSMILRFLVNFLMSKWDVLISNFLISSDTMRWLVPFIGKSKFWITLEMQCELLTTSCVFSFVIWLKNVLTFDIILWVGVVRLELTLCLGPDQVPSPLGDTPIFVQRC